MSSAVVPATNLQCLKKCEFSPHTSHTHTVLHVQVLLILTMTIKPIMLIKSIFVHRFLFVLAKLY